MKINDEDNYTIFCKRAFSEILEGVHSNSFSCVSLETSFSGKKPMKEIDLVDIFWSAGADT